MEKLPIITSPRLHLRSNQTSRSNMLAKTIPNSVSSLVDSSRFKSVNLSIEDKLNLIVHPEGPKPLQSSRKSTNIYATFSRPSRNHKKEVTLQQSPVAAKTSKIRSSKYFREQHNATLRHQDQLTTLNQRWERHLCA